MTTLIYSPGIVMAVDTARDGQVDLTEDIISGSLTLRENGSHNFSVQFNNTYRKYDGIFTPNDRVVIQLKRLKWLQVFAGYLDDVPLYSTYPRVVELSGQCTLKVFKNWPWDARSEKARQLLLNARSSADKDAEDGGAAAIATKLITDVVGWPEDRIHIGSVPRQWIDKFQDVYKAVSDDVESAAEVIGSNPILSGRIASVAADGTDSTVGSAPISVKDDISIIMLTIRTLESGNNYQAVNRGDGKGDIASGAYQFTTTTWGNYGGYADAYLAPRAVQDNKAIEYINSIIAHYGNKLVNIPYGWYYPAVFRNPSLLDTIPAQGEGNSMTIRQYGEKWVKTYAQVYEQVMGKPPAITATGVAVANPAAPSPTSTTASPSDALYPIPQGVSSLDYQKVAWGGYSNGKIPNSAMKYGDGIGWGHPAAINSLTLLLDAAKQEGYDFRGGCYRSYEQQVRGAEQSSNFATPGRSIHGWGLAMDFAILTNASSKYGGYLLDQMYDTPEYKWLTANAWKWGWGHPSWGQRGGSKPEPWHWEFFAFENFRNSPEAKPGVGYNPSAQGANPFAGLDGELGSNTQAQLFNTIAFWNYDEEVDPESWMLTGIRATMNDTPVMQSIAEMIGVANRSYCAAPNGDFIAWFPDYWGEYNTAGRMNVELIELQDFSVRWNDSSLITHQFVEGSLFAGGLGPLPEGFRTAISGLITAGIATVEIPRFLDAIINTGGEQFPWLRDPEALLKRFGARINRQYIGTISGKKQEFWYATHLFLQAWANMFRARVPLTFMPEMFPGMLLCIPELKVQFYVRSVTHSWNMANDVGFSTDVEVCAPSATDGSGFFLFPRGGTPPVRSTAPRGVFRS